MRILSFMAIIAIIFYSCLDSKFKKPTSVFEDLDKSFGIDNETKFEDKLYKLFTTEHVYPISIPWLELDIRLNTFKKYNGNKLPAGIYEYPNEEGILCVDVFNSIDLGNFSRKLNHNYFLAPIHLFYTYGKQPMNSVGLFVYDRIEKTITHVDSKRLPNTIYNLVLEKNGAIYTTENTMDTVTLYNFNTEGFIDE